MSSGETAEIFPDPQARFQSAVRRFDEENARDPHAELMDGVPVPRELRYARRLTEWVLRLNPEASEELRLAARCQHLCRWMIPRDSYEMSRAGYLRWRGDLKSFHARRAGEVLRELRYPEDLILRVQDLNLKRHFPEDPSSRTLEDALCLVFLECQLGDLAAKTSEEKVINALRKSWDKMTAAARELALQLELPPRERDLIRRALEPE